jgi:WD40 repeat protein/tetratricopeptide (TPR) repeat protein
VHFAAQGEFVAITDPVVKDGIERLRSRCWRLTDGERVGPELPLGCRLLHLRDGRDLLMSLPEDAAVQASSEPAVEFRDVKTQGIVVSPELDGATGGPFLRVNGRLLVTLDRDGRVRWWDPATGRQARKPWLPLHSGVGAMSVGLTDDGRTAVILGADSRVRWYDLATGESRATTPPFTSDRARQLSITPDGRRLLVTTWGGTTRLWQVNELAPARCVQHAARLQFGSASYSPDLKRVFVGNSSIEQRLYGRLAAVDSRSPLGEPIQGANGSPVFSRDGQLLATHTPPIEGPGIFARVWDGLTCQPRSPNLPAPTYIHSIEFSPDGRWLAVGCVDFVLIYDIESAQLLHTLRQEGPATRLRFSPNGRWLATASRSGWKNRRAGVRIWDAHVGQPTGDYILTHAASQQYTERSADAAHLHFSADSKLLTTLELAGGRLRVWDAATGQPKGAAIELHPGLTLERAAFRSDGTRLLTGYADGDVRVWDAITGQALGPSMPHPAGVVKLAFSSQGDVAAVGCADGTVRVWDVAQALPLGPPLTHRCAVIGMAFGPTERILLTTTSNGITRSWNLDVPRAGTLDHLTGNLQALTGSQIVSNGQVLLAGDAWQALGAHVSPAIPDTEAARRSDSAASWLAQRFEEAQEEGDLPAALAHLDRLLARDPSNLNLRLNRAGLLARLGRLDEADATFQMGSRSPDTGTLASWYAHAASGCMATADWKLAHWYCDRLVAVRPNDWRPYSRRADVLLKLGDTTEAVADLERAVERGAEQGVLLRLAEAYAATGRWNDATACFTKASTQGGLTQQASYRFALSALAAGDHATYQRICQASLQALGLKPHPHRANDAVMTCALGPGAVADWSPPVKLMEQAIAQIAVLNLFEDDQRAHRHAFLNTLGAVLYRAGRPKQAVARLLEAIAESEGEGTWHDWLFLALAHHALGNADEARRWLTKADTRNVPSATAFSWESVELELLLREAQKLIAPATGTKEGPAVMRESPSGTRAMLNPSFSNSCTSVGGVVGGAGSAETCQSLPRSSYISGSCFFNSSRVNGKKSFRPKYASVVSAKYSIAFVIA